jgi:hypothetical protein
MARPTTPIPSRGFMLIAGRTSKRYYAQTLVNGRQVRVKVGNHPALTAREACEAARQRLASMRAGTCWPEGFPGDARCRM